MRLLSLIFLALIAIQDVAASTIKQESVPDSVFENLPSDPSAAAATLVYRLENLGYALVVVTPSANGSFLLEQGRITQIEVLNGSQKVTTKIKSLLAPLMQNDVLTIDTLDNALSLVNDLHGVKVSFALNRLGESAEYLLQVNVAEHKSSGIFAVDTSPRSNLSQRRVTLHQEYFGVIEGGDVLRLDLSFSEGEQSQDDVVGFDVGYQAALDHRGAFYEVGLGRSSTRTDIGVTAVAESDYTSDYLNVIVGKDLARQHDRSEVIYAEGMLVKDRHDGLADGNLAVLRGSYFSRKDLDDGVSGSYGVTVSWGKEDHHINADDKNFSSLRLGFGRIMPMLDFGDTAELKVELAAQVATKDTPDSELFYLGSTDALRGFDLSRYAGETGASLVIEGAYSEILGKTSIKPFTFLDVGYVENSSLTTATSRPSSNVIASAGIGLDYQFNDSLNSIRMWLGKPVHDDESALQGPTSYVQFQTAW